MRWRNNASQQTADVYKRQLRSWLKAAGAPSPGQADRQNRDARRLRELEAEIRALRKKLEEKDGVIDILKKSVGILSKP